MPNQVNYGDSTVTEYSELKNYLLEKLKELGKIKLHENEVLGAPYYNAKITLYDFPKVKDWSTDNDTSFLHINSTAGGCFIRHISVNCHQLPKADRKECEFRFELALSTNFVPLAEHSEQLVKMAIDEFVKEAKQGFCYFFQNS